MWSAAAASHVNDIQVHIPFEMHNCFVAFRGVGQAKRQKDGLGILSSGQGKARQSERVFTHAVHLKLNRIAHSMPCLCTVYPLYIKSSALSNRTRTMSYRLFCGRQRRREREIDPKQHIAELYMEISLGNFPKSGQNVYLREMSNFVIEKMVLLLLLAAAAVASLQQCPFRNSPKIVYQSDIIC